MEKYENLQTLYRTEEVTVSRAIRLSDRKSVVIKKNNTDIPNQRNLNHFQYEYELSNRYPLKGIVPIMALEKQGYSYTLVMEDVNAIPLLDYWENSDKSIAVFLNLSIGIVNNLLELHNNEFIHKNIKPSSILVQKDTEKIYFIDMAFATHVRENTEATDSPEGSMYYISPEQTGRLNQKIDFRSDLYSLGITLYELLTGAPPFTGDKPLEVIFAHIAVSPKPPKDLNPLVPPTLSDLILRLLAKNPDERYRAVTELLEDLSLAKELNLAGLTIEFPIAQNSLERLVEGIPLLPKTSLEILKFSSCIGHTFSTTFLSKLLEQEIPKTRELLEPALSSKLILPVKPKKVSGEQIAVNTGYDGTNDSGEDRYTFIHEKVIRSVYSLLSDSEKVSNHIKIGKAYLELGDGIEENILEITDHLNYGLQYLSTDSEREELVELNLKAGKKASHSHSYDSALKYLNNGIQLLQNNISKDLIFTLHYQYLDTRYKMGKVKEVREEIDSFFGLCQSKYDRVLLLNLKVLCQTSLGEYENSVLTCCEAMKEFGIELKSNITSKDIFQHYKSLSKVLKDKTIEELLNLPEMQDRDIKIGMEILMNTASSAYWKVPTYGSLFCFMMLDFSLEYGNSYFTSYAYSSFGITLVSIFEFEKAYEYGNLALRLLEKYPHPLTKLKIPLIVGFSINNWIEHSKKSVKLMMDCFYNNNHLGDIVYSSSIIANSYLISVILSTNIKQTQKYYNQFIPYLRENQSRDFYLVHVFLNKFVNDLSGDKNKFFEFEDNCLSEEEFLSFLLHSELKVSLYTFYVLKLSNNILFHKKSPPDLFSKIPPLRPYGSGMLIYSHDIFLSALCIVKGDRNNNSELEYTKELEGYLKQLRIWSETNPSNFLHKYKLILAERAKQNKEFWEASGFYDEAIHSARENEYNLDTALCSELAGIFYLESNRIEQAGKYLRMALEYYTISGAFAKTEDLFQKYPDLCNKFSSKESELLSNQNPSPSPLNSNLDIYSLAKLTTALSAEINPNSLINKIIYLLIENAGATKGILLLYSEEVLQVKAIATSDKDSFEVYENLSWENYPDLPHSVIKKSEGSLQMIHLDSAWKEGDFTFDPYIIKEKVVSLLCLPIQSKGKTIGFLYLENNLIQSAFRIERLEILKIIISQFAISLENALLYDSLEKKVKERTTELETQKSRLEKIQSFTALIQNAPDFNTISENIRNTFLHYYGLNSYLFYLCNLQMNRLELLYAISDKIIPDSILAKLKINHIPFDDDKSIHVAVMKYAKSIHFKKLSNKINNISSKEIENMEILGIDSIYIIPLIISNKVFAILSFADIKPEFQKVQSVKHLSSKEKIDIELLCKSISSGLFRSLQKEEIESQKKYIENLNFLVKKLNDSDQLEIVFREIHQHIKDFYGVQHCAVGVVDESQKYAVPIQVSYINEEVSKEELYSIQIPITDTVGGHAYAFKTNKPLLSKSIKVNRITPEEFKISAICNFKSCLIIPLIVNRKNIGFLDLYNLKDTELKLSREQITQLSILAEQLSGIIHRMNLNIQLESQKKQLERSLIQSDRMITLGTMVAGVAHEINTPLSAIKANSENISTSLESLLQSLNPSLSGISTETLQNVVHILELSQKSQPILSSKEQRAIRRKIATLLEQKKIQKTEENTDLILELGLHEALEMDEKIFYHPSINEILQIGSQLKGIQKKTGVITTSADRVSRLVKSLKSFMHFEQSEEKKPAFLSEGMETVLTILHNKIKYGIEVTKNYKNIPQIPCFIDELNQIWTNLIHNAIQAMGEKGTLHIEMETISSLNGKPDIDKRNPSYSGDYVAVSIQDSGHGIPVHIREKIFQAFFTTKSAGEGSGLGLHIIGKILEKHRGALYLESEPGKTRFTVILPVSDS